MIFLLSPDHRFIGRRRLDLPQTPGRVQAEPAYRGVLLVGPIDTPDVPGAKHLALGDLTVGNLTLVNLTLVKAQIRARAKVPAVDASGDPT